VRKQGSRSIPKASLENQVEVKIANRLAEPRILRATANIEVHTSASLFGKVPMYGYFRRFTLVGQDGTEHEVEPVWSTGDAVKSFTLGTIGPGETVKVRIGRKLESVARTDHDSGAIQEDISITFSLD
jgi:hypothetical protein